MAAHGIARDPYQRDDICCRRTTRINDKICMFLRKLYINQSQFPSKAQYPFNLEVFEQTKSITFEKNLVFFAGENGSGKSTLLKAIARKCDIHLWCESEYTPLVRNPYADLLHTCIELDFSGMVPGAFFAAQNFKRYAEMVDDWAKVSMDYLQHLGGESLSSKSHGQTNMQYFRNRFNIKGLYLLDEPEAALSPRSQLELIGVITEAMKKGDVQFIIATHSPILLAMNDAQILDFNAIPISTIHYTETDYYKIYKTLMNR